MLFKLNESIWIASAEPTLRLARPPFKLDTITRFDTDTAQPQRGKAQAYTIKHNKADYTETQPDSLLCQVSRYPAMDAASWNLASWPSKIFALGFISRASTHSAGFDIGIIDVARWRGLRVEPWEAHGQRFFC